MRIIGGKYRGKKLFTPQGKDVRPTADRAREALFSILYSRLGGFADLRVVDVFAGTGAFALEALSRGAQTAACIDKDTTLCAKNAKLFPDFSAKIKLLKADAANLPSSALKYNLAFLDAPYKQGLTEPALRQLAAKGWLEDGALCLVETRNDEVLDIPQDFVLDSERFYGLAKISILVYK